MKLINPRISDQMNGARMAAEATEGGPGLDVEDLNASGEGTGS